MEKGDDPYEILGVPYTADEGEIKKAYRKAALKWHPDRQTTDEEKAAATDVFAKLSAAYETLTDPVKRYDWKQANEDKMKGKNNSTHSAPVHPPKSATKQAPAPAPKPAPRPSVPSTNTPKPGPRPFPASVNTPKPTPKRASAPPPSSAPFTSPRTPKKATAQPPKRTKSPRPSQATGYSNNSHTKEDAHAPKTSYTNPPQTKDDINKPNGSYSMQNGETFKSPKATKKRLSKMKPDSPGKSDGSYSLESREKTPVTRKNSLKKSNSNRSIKTARSTGARPSVASRPTAPSKSPMRKRHSFGAIPANRNRSKSPKRTSASPRPTPRKSTMVEQAPPVRNPRPGGRRLSAPPPRSGAGKPEPFHDPMEVFDRVMREEFGNYYKESDESGWKKASSNWGGTNRSIKASAAPNKNDPNAVVAMSTSTKKEKRRDGQVEIKTITKIVRQDGSIEKVVQASITDKEAAKKIKNNEVTMNRQEKKKGFFG